MLFKLIGGSYRVGKKLYLAGETVKSEFHLDKIFVNKFQRLHEEPAPVIAAAISPPEAIAAAVAAGAAGVQPATLPAPPAPPDNALGAVVTHEFSGAAEAGLVVYRKGQGKYNITKTSDPDVALHDGTLTKKGVLEFVAELTSE